MFSAHICGEILGVGLEGLGITTPSTVRKIAQTVLLLERVLAICLFCLLFPEDYFAVAYYV